MQLTKDEIDALANSYRHYGEYATFDHQGFAAAVIAAHTAKVLGDVEPVAWQKADRQATEDGFAIIGWLPCTKHEYNALLIPKRALYPAHTVAALAARVAQLEHIATVQPFARWQWRETAQDCDDMVQMFRGWLASHGLGNLAIGYASIRYYTGATPTGRHAVAIAMDDGGKVWLIDPQQPGLHPVTARLGGNDLATRAQLLFVMH